MKEIPLNRGMVAIVDDDDYLEISKYQWYAHKHTKKFYAERMIPGGSGRQKTVRMHRSIIGTPEGIDTDHINGNTLDNRRSNLRAVPHRANCQNRHQIKTSEYPGVSWYSNYNMWRSVIQISGKFKHLGYFNCEEDAASAYQTACRSITGVQ